MGSWVSCLLSWGVLSGLSLGHLGHTLGHLKMPLTCIGTPGQVGHPPQASAVKRVSTPRKTKTPPPGAFPRTQDPRTQPRTCALEGCPNRLKRAQSKHGQPALPLPQPCVHCPHHLQPPGGASRPAHVQLVPTEATVRTGGSGSRHYPRRVLDSAPSRGNPGRGNLPWRYRYSHSAGSSSRGASAHHLPAAAT